MRKKIVATMMVMLMSATVLACIPSVCSKENPLLAEQRNHVTPEQWIEIEMLLDSTQGSKAKPDLEIIDFKLASSTTMKAKVWNSGGAYCPAFSTIFEIFKDSDWRSVGIDYVWLGLMSGYTVWTYSNTVPFTGYFQTRVWADYLDIWDEESETNNVEWGEFTFG